MTDDERERISLREWIEDKLNSIDHRLERMEQDTSDRLARIEQRIGEHVTWKALGTVILVAVAVATLLLMIAGGK